MWGWFKLETARASRSNLCARFGIAGYVRWQDFDGNGAIEPGISGLVDLSHPAFADFLGDFVMGDGLAYQRSLQDRGKSISRILVYRFINTFTYSGRQISSIGVRQVLR